MIGINKAKGENSSSMKVLLLNQEYPPIGGGGANATYHLLNEYSQVGGVQIHMITAAAGGNRPSEWIYPNICLHFVKIDKKRLDIWTQRELLEYAIKAYLRARRLAHEIRFDICHAFFTIPCGLVAYAMAPDLPYILSLRGSDVPGFNARFSFQYPFLKPIVRHLWRRAAMVVANSQWLKELALKTYPECEIHVVPNGVDCEFFQPASGCETEIEQSLKIVCVSRLIGRKGVDLLLEAFSSACLNGSRFKLLIAGGGPLEAKLKKKSAELGISDKVKFLGNKNRSEVVEILRGGDIFVLPSHSEGMSNSLLEAMACGLPVVATDTGDSSLLIDGNGRVVPPGDIRAMAGAIAELSSSRNLRAQMGTRSRKIALGLTWGAVAGRYLSAYEKIISGAQKCAAFAVS